MTKDIRTNEDTVNDALFEIYNNAELSHTKEMVELLLKDRENVLAFLTIMTQLCVKCPNVFYNNIELMMKLKNDQR